MQGGSTAVPQQMYFQGGSSAVPMSNPMSMYAPQGVGTYATINGQQYPISQERFAQLASGVPLSQEEINAMLAGTAPPPPAAPTAPTTFSAQVPASVPEPQLTSATDAPAEPQTAVGSAKASKKKGSKKLSSKRSKSKGCC